MTSSISLLQRIHALLERTYRMRSGLDDVGRFIIGDRGYRWLYGTGRRIERTVGSAHRPGARTLVRETPGELRACIYYPDEQIRLLEAFPPQRGLGEENVDAFAILVEELDHLLVIAERSRQERDVTLFELELHANLSKHLVLTRFLAGSRRCIDDAGRTWLRHHLFEKGVYCDGQPEVRRRYADAARWAVKLIDALMPLEPADRLRTLRRFHRAGAGGKIELIERVAA